MMPILVMSSSVERIAKVRREAGAMGKPYHRTHFRATRTPAATPLRVAANPHKALHSAAGTIRRR
jgi:hypothetical protein